MATPVQQMQQPPRIGTQHADELRHILGRGQSQSCAALVDFSSGAVLTQGNPSERHGKIGNAVLVAMGSLLFQPSSADEARRKYVQERIAELGGLQMVAMLLDDCDLFLGRIPHSPLALVMKIRRTTPPSDPVVRGRSLRNMLNPLQNERVSDTVKRETQQSYSIWNRFLHAVAPKTANDNRQKALQGLLAGYVHGDDHVLSADLFDVEAGIHRDHYRLDGASPEARNDSIAVSLQRLFAGELDLPAALLALGVPNTAQGKVQLQIGELDYYWLRVPYYPALRIPFEHQRALLLYKRPRPNPALDWSSLDHAGLNLLRLRIGELLDSGLQTTTSPFPDSVQEFQAVLDQLRHLPQDDLVNRLDIGGFLPRPMVFEEHDLTQRCQECIYYLPHRQWCDLPELPVPVKPDWWCRLWKI